MSAGFHFLLAQKQRKMVIYARKSSVLRTSTLTPSELSFFLPSHCFRRERAHDQQLCDAPSYLLLGFVSAALAAPESDVGRARGSRSSKNLVCYSSITFFARCRCSVLCMNYCSEDEQWGDSGGGWKLFLGSNSRYAHACTLSKLLENCSERRRARKKFCFRHGRWCEEEFFSGRQRTDVNNLAE